MYRMLSLAMVLVALVLFVGVDVRAQVKDDPNTHTGKFLSATGKTFKMEDKGGKEHSHTLAATAKVIGLDGKEIRLDDLKRGQEIRVTTKEGDRTTALKVEAMRKNGTQQQN